MRIRLLAPIVSALMTSHAAVAQTVHVEVRGQVDYNFLTTGALAGVASGAPAVMRFDVDASNFINSPSFPVRGYPINVGSFVMTAGRAPIGLVNPQPAGTTPFLVIRDNDPAVDGFLVSAGIDFPIGIPINTGVTNCVLNFLRTFDVGTVFPSRNVLDILGTYNFEHMSSYQWTIDRGPGTPFEVVYQSIRLYRSCLADVAALGGGAGGDGQLTADDVVGYLAAFFAGNLAVADVASLGGAPQPDGQLTPDDLVVFLAAFFGGCQ